MGQGQRDGKDCPVALNGGIRMMRDAYASYEQSGPSSFMRMMAASRFSGVSEKSPQNPLLFSVNLIFFMAHLHHLRASLRLVSFGRDFSNASNRFSSGSVASNPLNMNAFPKLKNIVPMAEPRAVPGPKIAANTSEGIAPIGMQNHLACFG